jgi:hypothetical protein
MKQQDIEPDYYLVGLTPEGPFSGIKLVYRNDGLQDFIDELENVFGIIATESLDKSERIATKVPSNIIFEVKDGVALLVVNSKNNYRFDLSLGKLPDLKFNDDKDVAVKWTGDFFAILVRGQDNIDWLEELHQAVLNKDIALYHYSGRSTYFPIGGLELDIMSKYKSTES